jgi:hypothetical protein
LVSCRTTAALLRGTAALLCGTAALLRGTAALLRGTAALLRATATLPMRRRFASTPNEEHEQEARRTPSNRRTLPLPSPLHPESVFEGVRPGKRIARAQF